MSEPTEVERRELKRVKITLYSEWGWRIICFGLLVAGLWLKGNYVSLERYNVDQAEAVKANKEINKSIADITRLIEVMQEQNKVSDRHQKIIDDHETRLRALERKRGTLPP